MKLAWWKTLLLLLPGLGFVLIFVGIVLYMAAAQSLGLFNFAGPDALSLDHWRRMMALPRFWRAFTYSAYIAFWSSLLSVALAYPIALWLRRPFPGSALLSALLKAPLLVPGLVAAFLFINVISFHGFLNEFMLRIGLWSQPHRMQNDAGGYGVIFLQVWKQMPLALLILTGAIQALPDNVLNAARDLGTGPLDKFRKVIVPMTARAMQAALILIFIGAAGDFSFQAVAGPTSESSLAVLMSYTQTAAGDWNGAAVIAVMLMALAFFGSIAMAGAVQLVARAARG
jgi:putative spermidine/putrescine transport system permease protein